MLEAVANTVFPHRKMPGDLSGCEVSRDPERPWLLEIAEPLPTDAPSTAKPLCCYIRTVIFYEHPVRALPDRSFAEHDRVEVLLQPDDVVRFEGELFQIYGGRVSWDDTRWILTWNARRLKKQI